MEIPTKITIESTPSGDTNFFWEMYESSIKASKEYSSFPTNKPLYYIVHYSATDEEIEELSKIIPGYTIVRSYNMEPVRPLFKYNLGIKPFREEILKYYNKPHV